MSNSLHAADESPQTVYNECLQQLAQIVELDRSQKREILDKYVPRIKLLIKNGMYEAAVDMAARAADMIAATTENSERSMNQVRAYCMKNIGNSRKHLRAFRRALSLARASVDQANDDGMRELAVFVSLG